MQIQTNIDGKKNRMIQESNAEEQNFGLSRETGLMDELLQDLLCSLRVIQYTVRTMHIK